MPPRRSGIYNLEFCVSVMASLLWVLAQRTAFLVGMISPSMLEFVVGDTRSQRCRVAVTVQQSLLVGLCH